MSRICASLAMFALFLVTVSPAQEKGTTDSKTQGNGTPDAKEPAKGKSLSATKVPRRVFVSTSYAQLLRTPSVQEELKLSSNQRKRLVEVVNKAAATDAEAMKRGTEALKTLGPEPNQEEVDALRLNFREESARRVDDLHAAQLAVLDRAQRTRLEQIRLQASGPLEFKIPDFQRRMNLSADQIDLIDSSLAEGIVEERRRNASWNEEFGKLLASGSAKSNMRDISPDQVEKVKAIHERLGKELTQLRQSIDQSIFKILTKRQRANYQKMLGEPFDLNKETKVQAPAATSNRDSSK